MVTGVTIGNEASAAAPARDGGSAAPGQESGERPRGTAATHGGESSGRTGGAYGLYGPDSVAWQLNREATLLLAAGPRALLLQLAHPLVAEGVDQHSGFREDPWGRLRGTLWSYLRIVYGTEAAARDEIARLNRLHGSVRGPVGDPMARERLGAVRYEARDPELSLWVHATLIDSTIVAYDAWIEPLAEDRRAAFYEETRPIGRAFGIPDSLLPADYAAFSRYLDRMLCPGGPMAVTPTARLLAETILHPPLGPLAGQVLGDGPAWRVDAARAALDAIPSLVYDWLMWPALQLLPDAVREGYGIPNDALRRAVSAWLAGAFRAWRPRFPRGVRSMPQALAADERIAGRP